MELTAGQLAVLNVFGEHDIGKGQYLHSEVLNRARLKLPQQIQDDWTSTIKGLVDLKYLVYDPLGYGLSDMGHSHVHDSDDTVSGGL